jgi:hypothetical protein
MEREMNGVVRELLYSKFRAKPQPLLMGESFAIPAATLWAGSRYWVERYRELGLSAGDRVVIAMPRGAAHVKATLAAWWNGLTVVAAEPLRAAEMLVIADARLIAADLDLPFTLRPGHAGVPGVGAALLRDAGAPSPGVAIRFENSASVSYDELASELASIAERWGDEVREASAWSTREGLLGSLWASLFAATTIVVDQPAQRRAAA